MSLSVESVPWSVAAGDATARSLTPALPSRPLAVRLPSSPLLVWAILLPLLAGAVTAFHLVPQLRDILTDLRIARNAQFADDDRIGVSCANRGSTVDCEIQGWIQRDGAFTQLRIRRSVTQDVFASTEFEVLRDATDPTAMTLSGAIADMDNRIRALVLASGPTLAAMGLAALFGVVLWRRRSILKRLAGHPVQLAVVALEPDRWSGLLPRASVVRVDTNGRGVLRRRPAGAPLTSPGAPDRAFAVWRPGERWAVLLDEGLHVLALTDAERAAILEAIRAGPSTEAGEPTRFKPSEM